MVLVGGGQWAGLRCHSRCAIPRRRKSRRRWLDGFFFFFFLPPWEELEDPPTDWELEPSSAMLKEGARAGVGAGGRAA